MTVAIGGDRYARHEHVAIKQLPMISLIATWRSKCDRFDRHRSLPKRPGHSRVRGIWGAVNGATRQRLAGGWAGLGSPGAGVGRPSHGVGPGLPRGPRGRRRGLVAALPRARDRRGCRLAADYARCLYAGREAHRDVYPCCNRVSAVARYVHCSRLPKAVCYPTARQVEGVRLNDDGRQTS